jgi:predicted component of type VI protein secretion system
MKSHSQMSNHEPSDLIPLQDGMVISFINYEIRVNLEKKDSDVLSKEKEHLDQQIASVASVSAGFDATVKASEAPAMTENMSQPQTEATKVAVVEPTFTEPETKVEEAVAAEVAVEEAAQEEK